MPIGGANEITITVNIRATTVKKPANKQTSLIDGETKIGQYLQSSFKVVIFMVEPEVKNQTLK